MGKNFLGLDGLKHFWSKAKIWIIDRITTEVTAKIAEIVANAPEDLDTLKEIADWISSHANDAAAMNAEIKANTEAISGKADKNHTHIKSDITDFPTSLPANGGTADYANKIEPNYISKTLTIVTSVTTKYIKVADCTWNQTGTLQVHLFGNNFEDTLVINFGGGNSLSPMLCGNYNSNSHGVYSVIVQKGSTWNSNYSIYVKVRQLTDCNVGVALLKGGCTINITESTTAPTNISEWAVSDGFFGTLTGNVTGNLTGNAKTATSASKLTTARKTYVTLGTASTTTTRDWSGDTTIPVSGVLPVANGGTGQTTANAAANSFINSLTVGNDIPVDDDYYVCQSAGGGTTTTTYHRRPVSKLWNYIKGKISNVLGLTATNYGGKASTAGTADYAKRLKTFASWDNPYVYDETNGIRLYVFKITMSSNFNSILIQIYDDINYAKSRRYILGLWHQNNWGYSVSVTDLGGTINDALRVWLGNDGNVYLQAYIMWTSRISFSYLEDITNITVEKIGVSKVGSNKDIDGNVLFTPLTDPIIDCGAIRTLKDLSTVSKGVQYLKADAFIGNVSGTADKAVSVVDYGDTSKTIKIGYTGAGATVKNLTHIAGYLTGGTQIKNVSKDVLQEWAGIGSLSSLNTTDKSNLVSAINEVWSGLGGNLGLTTDEMGIKWYSSNITSGSYNSPYYANGIWVIGSSHSGSGIAYSTDGKTWYSSNITSGYYNSPYYANGIWVIGGRNNSGITYSTDGKTWTSSNITSGNYESPYYANGIWVIGGSGSGIKYSIDGKTWTSSNITTGFYNTPYCANGIWVISSYNNSGIKYSIDGKTWTSSNITSGYYESPYYANGIWVIGGSGSGIAYSTDGKTWTSSNITSGSYNSPYYANGIWVIGGHDSGITYSTDGKTWYSSNITSGYYNSPYYANGIWVIGGRNNSGITYSTDGKTWYSSNITSGYYNSPYYANGIWVIGGSDSVSGIKYSTFNSLNDLGSAFKGISELKSYVDSLFNQIIH